VVDSQTPAPLAAGAAPVLVERTPVETQPAVKTPPAIAAKIDQPPDAVRAPPTAVPLERATVDGDAAASAATASPRPARLRRESPPPAPARSDNATAPKPTEPRPPTVSARCSDILQKASLEPLTATEAAYLKRECR